MGTGGVGVRASVWALGRRVSGRGFCCGGRVTRRALWCLSRHVAAPLSGPDELGATGNGAPDHCVPSELPSLLRLAVTNKTHIDADLLDSSRRSFPPRAPLFLLSSTASPLFSIALLLSSNPPPSLPPAVPVTVIVVCLCMLTVCVCVCVSPIDLV